MKYKLLLFICTFLTFVSGTVFVKNALAANYILSGSVKDNSDNGLTAATINVVTPGTSTDVVTPQEFESWFSE